MKDPLLAFRSEFPILERTTYLVSNSLGAMPRTVPDRLAEYVDAWGEQGVRAWAQGWWQMPVEAGNEIAPLIGAGSGEVVMMPNVSIAQAVVLSAIQFDAGRDTIVMTGLDFPSVRYVYQETAPKYGARVVTVESDDGIGIDAAKVIAAIDERTRLVAISHVLFKSAYVMDVAAISRRAHEVGALVALDAFHSVGIMPVSVAALGVDFLTGGVLKWLCGGPGGAFLYIAASVRDSLAPSLTGWQAHARPFGFEGSMTYAEGAFRWLNGTPVIPALYAATEGPRLIRKAGIDAIRAKSIRQTARLIELADERGYKVNAPRDSQRRGGTVAVEMPNSYEISQHLLSRDIIVDYREGAGIRIAPHFYTSDEELERVFAEIDKVIESGAWREFSGRRGVVT